jgi:hypothetical protein
MTPSQIALRPAGCAAPAAVGAGRLARRRGGDWAVCGVEPKTMGIGPVPAVLRAPERAGQTLEDVDVIELNEAFASQSLAVMKDLDLDPAKVNPNGGAIALGHPISATGALITAKILSEIWSVRRLTAATGMFTHNGPQDWREHKLKPHQVRWFKFSEDPPLAEKIIDVVGLQYAAHADGHSQRGRGRGPERRDVYGMRGRSSARLKARGGRSSTAPCG